MNIILNKKPLSTNELWVATAYRRYRTAKYNKFIADITKQAVIFQKEHEWIKSKIKKGKKDIKNSSRAIFLLVFASGGRGEIDVDNSCKAIIDVLSKTYNFNDKVILSADAIKLQPSEFGCDFMAWELKKVDDFSFFSLTQSKKQLIDDAVLYINKYFNKNS